MSCTLVVVPSYRDLENKVGTVTVNGFHWGPSETVRSTRVQSGPESIPASGALVVAEGTRLSDDHAGRGRSENKGRGSARSERRSLASGRNCRSSGSWTSRTGETTLPSHSDSLSSSETRKRRAGKGEESTLRHVPGVGIDLTPPPKVTESGQTRRVERFPIPPPTYESNGK